MCTSSDYAGSRRQMPSEESECTEEQQLQPDGEPEADGDLHESSRENTGVGVRDVSFQTSVLVEHE